MSHLLTILIDVVSTNTRSIVTKILSERRDATEKRIAWQLESERKGIFTLNEEDLYSYKTSFVSACDDLHFSLSIDAGDPAVSIIGTVRGYFHGRWGCLWLGIFINSHRSVSQTLPRQHSTRD